MKKWYVVNTYSGHENKVRTTMERRIESLGLNRFFGEIQIPTESVIEIKNGKKVPVVQRQFPGYLLVNMDMNDNTWQIVRQTAGVTQIVGAGDKPIPLSRSEVERLLHPGEAGDPREGQDDGGLRGRGDRAGYRRATLGLRGPDLRH